MNRTFPLLLACTALWNGSGLASATQAPEPEATAFFETSIRPLLLERCIECHGDKKQKGGLRLDSKAAWVKGGDSGTSLHPGDPEKSLLIKAVRYTDKELQMPPKHQLSPREVALLEKWVLMGAPDPRSGTLTAPPTPGSEAVAKHWAFQPVTRPHVPSGDGHPVDAFVGTRLKTNGLAPNPASLSQAIREGKKTFEEAGGREAYFGFPQNASAEEGRETLVTLGAILADAVIADRDGGVSA